MISEARKKAEKRSTEVIIFAIILAAGTAATTYNNTNILDAGTSTSDGLVAEYRFDTGAGNTAYDTAGNNDGTIEGASWSNGVKGKALSFDGKDDYVEMSDPAFDTSSEITMAAWVKPDQLENSVIMNKLGSDSGYRLIVRSDSLQFSYGDGGTLEHIPITNGISTGEWYFVALTWDKQELHGYVNGKQYSKSLSDSWAENDKKFALVGPNPGGLGGDRYDGEIDNSLIYSKALNHSQIKSLYNRGSWRIGTTTKEDDPSKVLDISFQHQNRTHVYDTSGYENHAKIFGNARQSDAISCKVGRCYNFDGTSGTGVDLNNIWSDHTESRTFMFWFKEAESGASNNDRIISQDCSEWFCLVDEGFDSIEFGFDGFSKNPSISLNQNKWHHFTVVFNESGSNVAIYLDGRKRYESSYSPSWSHLARPVVLGGNTEGTDDISGNEWEGKIDQLKIFNRSLSQAEIIEKTQGLEADGAVLDMRFDSGGGDHVEDYSGEGNHGDLSPNESYGPDRENRSLSFDAADDSVSIGSPSFNLDTTKSITVSAWIKRPSFSGRDEMIFNKKGTDRLRFEITPSKLLLVTYSNSDDNWQGNRVSLSENIDDNEWHQVTWRVKNGDFEAFLDGELQGKTTLSQDMPNADGYAELGNGAGSAEHYGGLLRNLKVFTYSLSGSRISQLYGKGKSNLGTISDPDSSSDLKNDLVLSQTFDRIETCGRSDTITCPSGASGEIAVDESGEANHGELVNGPSVKGAGDCRVGGCLGFDGSDDRVVVSDDEDLNVSNDFAISGWLRLDGYDSNYKYLVDYKWEDNNNKVAYLGVHKNNAKPRAGFTNETGGREFLTGSTNMNDGKWHHLLLDYSSGDIKLYLDGEVEDSISMTGGIKEAAGKVSIGSKTGGTGLSEVDGSIDQVRVYNRSLSDQEVWKLYTKGRDRGDGMAGPVGWWRFDDAAVYAENFIPNGDFTDGNGVPSEYGSNPTNTIVKMENPGNSDWVLRQNGSNTEYEIHFKDGTSPKANITYVMSSWVAYTDDWDGDDQIFHARWYDGDGNGYTSGGSGHLIETREVDGLTWEHRYETITLPNTVNGDFNWYWGYRPDNTQGFRYMTNAQLEVKNYATEFVDGIRKGRVPDSAEDNEGQLGTSQTSDSGDPKVVKGKKGNALNFDGNDDHVEVSDSSKLDASDSVSVFTWMNADEFVNFESLVHKGDFNYRLMVESGPEMRVRLDDSSGNSFIDHDESFDFQTGKWYHVGFTYDQDSGTVKYYVDGNQIYSRDTGTHTLQTGNNPVKFGVEGSSAGGPRRYFDGKIDDVRIYPYALNKEQVNLVKDGGAVSVG